MAILRSDGILFADRLQIVALDGERRLLAQSAESFGHALVCDRAQLACHGYDHDEDLVVSLDPPGFRTDGPIVPDVADFEGVFTFPPGAWGFSARPATAGEWLEAEWAEIRRSWKGLILLALAGALCATIAFAGLGLWKKASVWSFAIWILGLAARFVAVAFVCLIVLYFCLLSGTCGSFLLVGMGLGGATYWLARSTLRRRRPAPA